MYPVICVLDVPVWRPEGCCDAADYPTIKKTNSAALSPWCCEFSPLNRLQVSPISYRCGFYFISKEMLTITSAQEIKTI